MLSAIILGPKYSTVLAGLADLIGALLFPFGSFFIGYTISALLTGLVYGLFLYNKDEFGFEMIQKGKFTTAQIDKATWTVEMLDLLMDFIKKDPRGKKYRNLDWSEEYRLAKEGNPDDTQTAL